MRLFIFYFLCVSFCYGQGIPNGFSHRGIISDDKNNPISNKEVLVKVTILDNGKDQLYIETHNVKTNSTGNYNIIIGNGLKEYPDDEKFNLSNINWGDDTKIKSYRIEVDLTGSGNNYSISGESQFFSVPYALFSLKTLSSNISNTICNNLIVLDKIADLRTTNCGFYESVIVYVKCHSNYWDGGGGFFILSHDDTVKNIQGNVMDDNDGTIIVNQNLPGYRWVRIIENDIDVRFFGCFGSGNQSINDGLAIQKAIDFAYYSNIKSAKSMTVYIPSGGYYIHNTITLRSGISIRGDGIEKTILYAYNSVQNYGNMFEIANGKIRGLHISNIAFNGNLLDNQGNITDNSVTKNCFHFKAKIGPGDHGGLESCSFKNLRISAFNGCGIILEGGGVNDDYKLPNQDLVFENVYITRQKDNSNCLLIQGQNSQITFTNCGFDGKMNWTDLNAGNNFNTNKLFNVVLENKGHIAPSVVKFNTCTFQYSEYGAYLRYAENITFDNCWFELLDRAIGIIKSTDTSPFLPSNSINILNSRFANASGFGSYWNKVNNVNTPPSGSCVYIEGSNVNILNNFVTVTNTINSENVFVRNYGIDSDINILNNTYQIDNFGNVKVGLGKTYGVANKNVSLNNDLLNTLSYKFISLNTYPLNIKEIKSNISVGETITIKANGTIKFDNSKNILFSKNNISVTNPFILYENEIATFIKIDNPRTINNITYNETYLLISVNKTY